MNILFVCHRFPFPPNRGGKIRPFNIIRHLSQKHSVVVGSLAHSERELRDGSGLKAYCRDIIAEVLPSEVRWMQAWRALFSGTPSSVAYFWSSRLHRRLQAAWQAHNFDMALVHCAFAAQYLMGCHGKSRILDFGDLDSAKWRIYAKWRPFPLSVGYALEAKKLRRYEQEVARHFDYCTVTTAQELEEFLTLNTAVPCTVMPNGVDSTFFHQRSSEHRDIPVIVFLGRMDYFPNIDGITHFAHRIFPRIREHIPRAELRIIGSKPVLRVRNLAKIPGVSVTGSVPDVRPHLIEASLSVAPLRIARGTQNKILESMAMGIPVVATPEAAKGVRAVPGKHLLVAEGPEEFAAQVIRVLTERQLREELSKAGRQQVETAYVWSFSMQTLDNLLGYTIAPHSTLFDHREQSSLH